jgi:hypothetical protein
VLGPDYPHNRTYPLVTNSQPLQPLQMHPFIFLHYLPPPQLIIHEPAFTVSYPRDGSVIGEGGGGAKAKGAHIES